MAKNHPVSVRTLAEFALEGGDLAATSMNIARMQDGLRGHREVQAAYAKDPRYKSEVPIRLMTELCGVSLIVQGRMDGLLESEIVPLIEEIKTTVDDPRDIPEDAYPVHWAQAEIYAHMLAQTRRLPAVEVRLTYYNLSGHSASFTRHKTAAQLEALFLSYATPYAQWVAQIDGWHAISRPTIAALSFPFDEYREGQRDMAANAYIALREGRKLLCQAPTGIGKTAAALYPALKALGEERVSHIFYLTARTTARRAAEDALERMRGRGLIARSVTLTAKDKICANPTADCTPEECPLARGYYDRRRQALREALLLERLSRADIEALAAKHTLCPFELSLDLSETADVIVCDYNYAFDPSVKLKRFFLDKGDYALLIDEAHNLPDRARDFLSALIDSKAFQSLRRDAGKHSGRKTPLYKTLTGLLNAWKAIAAAQDEPAIFEDPIFELTPHLEAFLETAKPLLDEPLPYRAALLDQYFMAFGYLRTLERYDGAYRTEVLPAGSSAAAVKLWCYDPSTYLAGCMKRVKGTVLFSATLTPMAYYAQLLGLDENEGDALLDLPSPFPRERLKVIRLGLNTRYRHREHTAHDLARAILSMCRAKVGNYIACFPSHAYLNLIAGILAPMAGDIEIVRQWGSMKEEDREAFLENFAPHPEYSMLALIAMGGIFSEGIDLPGDRLSGAAIVGVGIPQIGFERDTLRDLMDAADEGYQYAYVYPGIERVLQAAGRVIRTDTDKGCVLLLDDRFAQGEYPSLLPRHWDVRPARTLSDAEEMLRAFWAEP